MIKVIVGSHNPIKLETTKEAFAIMFPNTDISFQTFNSPSGVPEQPFGGEETKTGAKNRADGCKQKYPEADYWVGIEGGLEKIEESYWTFAWICIQAKEGKTGFGKTSSFQLPPKVNELINKGYELGHACDLIFNETNSGQKEGAVSILTKGKITRKDFYRDAVTFALIPSINPDLY